MEDAEFCCRRISAYPRNGRNGSAGLPHATKFAGGSAGSRYSAIPRPGIGTPTWRGASTAVVVQGVAVGIDPAAHRLARFVRIQTVRNRMELVDIRNRCPRSVPLLPKHYEAIATMCPGNSAVPDPRCQFTERKEAKICFYRMEAHSLWKPLRTR